MDLPERLIPRIQSRIAMRRIVFEAYNRDQITRIIEDRLCDLEVFDKDSIKMCALKVTNTSGDIRRALMICRRAVEISSELKDKYKLINILEKLQ